MAAASAHRGVGVLLAGMAGLAVGVGAAVAWHYTHTNPDYGWTFYLPLNGDPPPAPVRPSWWPTGVLLPAGGMSVGLLLAAARPHFRRLVIVPSGKVAGR
jgi:hypothetical protein